MFGDLMFSSDWSEGEKTDKKDTWDSNVGQIDPSIYQTSDIVEAINPVLIVDSQGLALQKFPTTLSERGKDWVAFSIKVLNHIENYTVPQYGDRGEDQCTEFTHQDFLTQIKKYTNRFGKNVRDGQEGLDLLKIAHYAQMLYHLSDIE